METIDFAERLNLRETGGRYGPLDIVREFLDHLGRIPRTKGDKPAPNETHRTNL